LCRARREEQDPRMDLFSIPPPPREPSPRARDLVFRYQGTQKALLLVGAIFAAVGTAMAIPFCWGLPSDLALAAAGRAQHGRVLSAELDRSVRINGRNPTAIQFSYSVDGVKYQGQSSTTDRALAAQARPDDSVPIEVSGLNPRWSRVTGSTRSMLGYAGLFVLIFPLVGFLLVGFAARSNRREIRAFVHGQPVKAKRVFAGLDRSTTINGRNPFRVDWEFRVDGSIYSGSISSMSTLALEDFAKAQELTVLYDPADPSVNTLWVV
jgi:hypothetical protein